MIAHSLTLIYSKSVLRLYRLSQPWVQAVFTTELSAMTMRFDGIGLEPPCLSQQGLPAAITDCGSRQQAWQIETEVSNSEILAPDNVWVEAAK